MVTFFTESRSLPIRLELSLLWALDHIIQNPVEILFGNVFPLDFFPVQSSLAWFIYVSFAVPQEIEDVLYHIPILDHPELFEF